MSFFYPIHPITLAGKTLIVPVVSTANVSQLAVDLLIVSLSLKQIGIFNSKDLVPVVGGREDEEGLTTPLELYGRDEVNVVIMQQRSPVMKTCKEEFTRSLSTFVQTSGFAACVFLSGVDMSNRTDAQMMTPTYYIHPPNTPPLVSPPLSSLSQLPIPEYTSPVMQYPPPGDEVVIPPIPGGGLTRRFLSSISDNDPKWSIPVAALLQFVIEGDNRADANLFAVVVAKVLALDIRNWKQPTSWMQGLFGTAHDQSLYG